MALDPERFADIVAQALELRLAPILARLAAVEARALVPGPAGRDGLNGKDGTDGRDGRDGKDGVDGKDGAPGLHGKDGRDGVDVKEGRLEDLSPDVIAESVDALLRKELATLAAAAPPQITRRVIRDARGRIASVIEEATR